MSLWPETLLAHLDTFLDGLEQQEPSPLHAKHSFLGIHQGFKVAPSSVALLCPGGDLKSRWGRCSMCTAGTISGLGERLGKLLGIDGAFVNYMSPLSRP